MSQEPVAETIDQLCADRTGPEIVALVRERFPEHLHDPLQALFFCTYAKVHGGAPHALHESCRARVMQDYLNYFGKQEASRALPDYFVRPLLPGYLGGSA